MNKKVIIISSVGIVAVALLIYFLFFFKKNDKDFPLQYGSRNSQVGNLQTKLNARLSALDVYPIDENGQEIKELVIDDIFGAKTLAVVKAVLGTESVTKKQYDTI